MTNPLKATDRGRTPLFIRMYQLLRKRLETGEWPIGTQMPTIEQLMVEYDVSRITIREALSQLDREGLISRSRGKGTHVIGNAREERWLILPTDWKGLVHHIEQSSSKIVELDCGPGKPRLEPSEGTPANAYWRARRLNLTDGDMPYSLATIYLARDVFRLAPTAFARGAILPVLDKLKNVKISNASQRMTVTTADIDTAKHLRIEVGAPVAEVRRVARDQHSRAVYVAEVLYPARHLAVDTTLL